MTRLGQSNVMTDAKDSVRDPVDRYIRAIEDAEPLSSRPE
jgi:hypothetical protein